MHPLALFLAQQSRPAAGDRGRRLEPDPELDWPHDPPKPAAKRPQEAGADAGTAQPAKPDARGARAPAPARPRRA